MRRERAGSASNHVLLAYHTETQKILFGARSAAASNGEPIARVDVLANVTNGSESKPASSLPRSRATGDSACEISTSFTESSGTPCAGSHARRHAVDNPASVGTPIDFPTRSLAVLTGESFATARIVEFWSPCSL